MLSLPENTKLNVNRQPGNEKCFPRSKKVPSGEDAAAYFQYIAPFKFSNMSFKAYLRTHWVAAAIYKQEGLCYKTPAKHKWTC